MAISGRVSRGDIYTVEHCSAIEQNEVLPFARVWKDLEGVVLSEIVRERQTPRDYTSLWKLKNKVCEWVHRAVADSRLTGQSPKGRKPRQGPPRRPPWPGCERKSDWCRLSYRGFEVCTFSWHGLTPPVDGLTEERKNTVSWPQHSVRPVSEMRRPFLICFQKTVSPLEMENLLSLMKAAFQNSVQTFYLAVRQSRHFL